MNEEVTSDNLGARSGLTMEEFFETERGVPLAATLDRMPAREQAIVQFAYEFFDERMPGRTMDQIQGMAATGRTTREIYRVMERCMPTEARAWPPRMHEMLALAIECAVRSVQASGPTGGNSR